MFQAAVFRQCLVCCLSIPPDVAPLFICKGCDFRGDLGLGAPENQWRLQQRGLGQSSDPPAHASSAAPQLSRLDRLFATAAAAGVDQPLFVGPAAGALLPHTDALAEVRKCHNGTAYKHPSEQLVALVRAGKLASVAHAVPKPLEALGAGDDIKGGLELGANGALVARGADLQAPPVSSLAEFCAALFGVILPALSDRPRAMLQWISLARTALELSKKRDWPTAAKYIAQQLNECIPQAAPFATVNAEIVNGVLLGPIAAASESGAPRQGAKTETCGNWNNGHCPWGADCRFAHICKFANRGCDSANGHTGKECPRRPIGGDAPGPGSSQRARAFKQGGGAAASKRTSSAASITTAATSKV